MNRIHVTVPSYIFWPLAYLATLAVSIGVLWWVILIGGNPFVFRDIVAVDALGEATNAFTIGEVVGVRRQICSSEPAALHNFPTLRDQRGLTYSLPSSFILVKQGCSSSIYGFVMPPLPPGIYTYTSVARFQTNLVGRDEYTSSPPLTIEVSP